MNLVSVRIITENVDRLTAFYEKVTGVTASRPTPIFSELRTGVGTLAIGGTPTLQPFGGTEIAEAAANRTAIIEFRVDDVDADYARLEGELAGALVQSPTTLPWGNRSLLFRDPDGNLVNLFTPVTEEAIARLAR